MTILHGHDSSLTLLISKIALKVWQTARAAVQELVKDQNASSGMPIPGYSAEHAQHVLKAVLKGIGVEPGPSMKAASQAGAPRPCVIPP